jgi:hypothetical protein
VFSLRTRTIGAIVALPDIRSDCGWVEERARSRRYTQRGMWPLLHRTVFLLTLLLPLTVGAQAPSGDKALQTPTSTPGIPTFYADARQVIVEAEIWNHVDPNRPADTTWIPESWLKIWGTNVPDGAAKLRKLLGHLSPARGLPAEAFHVFDNGVEQRINYFKETEFPAQPAYWQFSPTTHGLWGSRSLGKTPAVSYVVGYVPPALQPGECRSIKIVVQNRDVNQNRDRYCAMSSSKAQMTQEETKLESRMRSFASSNSRGAIEVSVRPFAFWSSGVLTLAARAQSAGAAPVLPASGFTYVVEVHDSKAPATVMIATQFSPPYPIWIAPCAKNAAIHVLGIVYKKDGEFEQEFGDTFRCETITIAAPEPIRRFAAAYSVPNFFDTQIELRPGEYELRLAVTDGKKFGRARVPLRVEPLDAQALTVSNIVLNSILRDSSWILRDATDVSPDPILPAPLVSKNVQFLPIPDTQLSRGTPLSVYFEIYEPLLETNKADVFYSLRITDLKAGALVMNTGPISAADWVAPGNAVVPIGLKLDTDKLGPSSYRLEVQASDSAGRQSEWEEANFNVD